MNRRGFLRFLFAAPMAAPAAAVAPSGSYVATYLNIWDGADEPTPCLVELHRRGGGVIHTSEPAPGESIFERIGRIPWRRPGPLTAETFVGELVEAGAGRSKNGGYSFTFGVARFGVQTRFDMSEQLVGLHEEFSRAVLLAQQQHQQHFDRQEPTGQLDRQIVERMGHRGSSLSAADTSTACNRVPAAQAASNTIGRESHE